MIALDWLDELAALAERFADNGLILDLGAMSMEDRYGALMFLRRLADAD